jgi:hypothetical protein
VLNQHFLSRYWLSWKNAVGLSWWCEKDTVIHPIITGCTPFQCSTLPTSSSSGSDWFNKNIWRKNPSFFEWDNANMLLITWFLFNPQGLGGFGLVGFEFMSWHWPSRHYQFVPAGL